MSKAQDIPMGLCGANLILEAFLANMLDPDCNNARFYNPSSKVLTIAAGNL